MDAMHYITTRLWLGMHAHFVCEKNVLLFIGTLIRRHLLGQAANGPLGEAVCVSRVPDLTSKPITVKGQCEYLTNSVTFCLVLRFV